MIGILAIDPATQCGWAHSNGASGSWDLSISQDESSGMRLIRFESKLREIIAATPTRVIVFESVTAGQGLNASLTVVKLQTKMQAIIERLCEEIHGLEHKGYNLQAIKAHALPVTPETKGQKRDKAAMIAAAKKKWPGLEIVDDNQVDALWLLDLAKRELGGQR